MNDPFVHEQAKKFANRIKTEKKSSTERIHRAYLLLYGRIPTKQEVSAATDYLVKVSDKLKATGAPADQVSAKAWESLSRALFLSNEFVYVE
jgi:hypothetical protein